MRPRRILFAGLAGLVLLLLMGVVRVYLPIWVGEHPDRALSWRYWQARWHGEDLFAPEGTLWRGNRALPDIALTFDDGPDPNTTPIVLDILKAEGVRATFFLVGKKIKQHPEIVKRMIAEGHAIGCHSYDHQPQTRLTEEQVWKQIRDSQILIRRVGGQFVAYRPPWLHYNRHVLNAAHAWGLPVVIRTLASDPIRTDDPDAWVDFFVRRTRNGAILLMHDIYPQTAAVLPRVLQELKARGYRFVTIPELIDHLPSPQRERAYAWMGRLHAPTKLTGQLSPSGAYAAPRVAKEANTESMRHVPNPRK
jgi:peptidoglycan/xylan/chitin deacetylase (PgdA/CDA1 family)